MSLGGPGREAREDTLHVARPPAGPGDRAQPALPGVFGAGCTACAAQHLGSGWWCLPAARQNASVFSWEAGRGAVSPLGARAEGGVPFWFWKLYLASAASLGSPRKSCSAGVTQTHASASSLDKAHLSLLGILSGRVFEPGEETLNFWVGVWPKGTQWAGGSFGSNEIHPKFFRCDK